MYILSFIYYHGQLQKVLCQPSHLKFNYNFHLNSWVPGNRWGYECQVVSRFEDSSM